MRQKRFMNRKMFMSRNYITAKKLTRKQKISYLFGRQPFLVAIFFNATVCKVSVSVSIFWILP